ncbi:MAG: hypothetical protein AAGA55_02905 [Planctomycetota bacterium]
MMSRNPSQHEPDFARDLYVADTPGNEFASMRGARIVAPGFAGQSVMAAIGLAGLLFAVLRAVFGIPVGMALLVVIPIGAAGLVYAVGLTIRASGGRKQKNQDWVAFVRATTDSRYRVRAIIPPNRRRGSLERWALLASGYEPAEPPQDPELEAIEGGFEPLIIRPWLGVRRSGAYRRFFWLTLSLLSVVFLGGGWWVLGSALFDNTFTIWGVMGLVIGGTWFLAEHAFPVYIRLAPGQLDVFRYAFLGRGAPCVTTYDLRVTPLCVDFGSATVALEPRREPGTPAPELVLGKRWPHHKEHPQGAVPVYVSAAMSPQRDAFCQCLIQAARTTEPTPPLPHDRLLG